VSEKIGFTLIELLVVIAVIALLLAVLMPSLALIRSKAHGVVCQAHVKQLLITYHVYADDNDDGLVGGNTSNKILKDSSWSYSWVTPPQEEDGTVLPDYQIPTLQQEVRGIVRGHLYPYVKDVKLYCCKGAKEKRFGGGYRSYSITGLMNGEYATPGSQGGYPKLAVTKRSQIERPDTKIVFLENTDSRGWNMGSWVMDVSGVAWVDPLAIWHGGSSTMGFADSHVEAHKWVSKSTKILFEEQVWGLNPNDYDGDRRDIQYMHRAFLPKW
jgi:prepilin-type N-terminal cleavage/methylation domain-containing protein/prepilin-type processing-associated H-X9-DG protein